MKIMTMTNHRTPFSFSRRTGAALLVVLLIAPVARAADAKASLQAQATDLFNSLTPEQRKDALLAYDDPQRNAEVYTGGKRAGVQLSALDEKQRGAAMGLLKSFTSDYGAKKCEAIAEQTPNANAGEKPGFDKYYLAFFGEPGKDAKYAWRLSEHHLTLVHIEIADGEPASFGPILLGANPPTLWDDEEDALIALYGAMSAPEREKAKQEGNGVAAKPMENHAGVKVSELSPTARAKVKAVYENRLKFFSDDIRARIEKLVAANGGIESMNVAFWGAAEKRCRDGGKWDFKLGNANFLCDYENNRKHIHMAMKGKLAEK
jgi:hypothetical protein